MRKSILIVDDEELNRELLKQMFEQDYDIILAENGQEAILKLGQHMDEVVVVLLDLLMPVVDGYHVLQFWQERNIFQKIPVVLITAADDQQLEFSCISMGAFEVINKPFVAKTVRKKVDTLISVYHNMDNLEERIKDQSDQLFKQQERLESFQEKLLETISNIVEFRNLETGLHVKRVKEFTRIMAETYQKMYPEDGLTKAKIENIVAAAAMHDIGKIAISDNILLKRGPLDAEERRIMQTHTTQGCEILNMLIDVQEEEKLNACYEICRHHHERYDGKGYPDGLVGEEIPISAQLVSIVDVYDALVSERVYKKAFPKEVAYDMITSGECGVFGPKLIACFKDARERITECDDSNRRGEYYAKEKYIS